MPCGEFADDVLTPGEGQIKAFIVADGNPVVAFPGQENVVKALDSLKLAVTLDNRMSQTAALPVEVSNLRSSRGEWGSGNPSGWRTRVLKSSKPGITPEMVAP